jgi:hypothetical protein
MWHVTPSWRLIEVLDSISQAPTNVRWLRAEQPHAPDALRRWADTRGLAVEQVGESFAVEAGERWYWILRCQFNGGRHAIEVVL